MTKFARTLITGLIITLGASASAQAADDTFTATFKIDRTLSVADNYTAFQTQAKLACRQEANRAGWRRTESTGGQQRKCEAQILKRAIKATKNPMMTAMHRQDNGKKVKIIQLAKN